MSWGRRCRTRSWGHSPRLRHACGASCWEAPHACGRPSSAPGRRCRSMAVCRSNWPPREFELVSARPYRCQSSWSARLYRCQSSWTVVCRRACVSVLAGARPRQIHGVPNNSPESPPSAAGDSQPTFTTCSGDLLKHNYQRSTHVPTS
eukprot:scaffold45354_cov57-Phaeocystis_antarctica.AAC.1